VSRRELLAGAAQKTDAAAVTLVSLGPHLNVKASLIEERDQV
jgi:hypothetical protein